MGWEDWKLLVVLPLTVGVVAVVGFAFKADANAAAAFFGAFAAAAATVIAVLLGGHVHRRNDLERERRNHAIDLAAKGTEISILLNRSANGIQVILEQLEKIASWNPRNVTLGYQEPIPVSYSSVINSLSTYCAGFEDRLTHHIGRFPRPVAEALIKYHAATTGVASIARDHVKLAELKSLVWIEQTDADRLASTIRTLVKIANDADKKLQEHLKELAVS